MKLSALVTVIATLCSVILVFVLPKKFDATARLFATYSFSAAPSNTGDVSTANTYVQSQIKSYIALAQTDAVLQPVISELDLDMTKVDLMDKVKTSNPSDTTFIDVTAEAADASQASDIANGIANSLQSVVSSKLYPATSSLVKLSVVQKADVPEKASSPKKVPYIAAGFILGLILGLLAALVVEILDKKIRNASDARAIVGAPIIGCVSTQNELAQSGPVVASIPDSSESEEFRGVRTSLSLVEPRAGMKARSLVFTASGLQEGTTTMAFNTAAALVENGASVLLIETNLHDPSLATKLGFDTAPGLVQVLAQEAPFSQAVQQYWKRNFHVLPVGEPSDTAVSLMNSKIMEDLLAQVSLQYDYVLIDAAPLNESADALRFGRLGDGILLVVGRNVGEWKDLRLAVTKIANANVPIIGTIFNFADGSQQTSRRSHGAGRSMSKRFLSNGNHRA
jgi:Mrp family chromosome partitioning ATPase/capsular polysaccharide biosynthesis protein